NMYECNHGSKDGCGVAQTFKNEVDQMMLDGKSNQEIKQYYLSTYGEKILMAPLKEGFSLTAWILPFVIMIAGLVTVFLVLRKWTRRNRTLHSAQPVNTGADPLQSQIYDSMIEEERKKYL
ncbi:cytochrome c-type biogenesis protein CcmH, partial [Effusibacillus lacus]